MVSHNWTPFYFLLVLLQEAEEMHIKAIQIKEQLLGQEDYEVALSVGHLASLYNYDMNQYDDAERLYLRSIAIGEPSIKVMPLLSLPGGTIEKHLSRNAII